VRQLIRCAIHTRKCTDEGLNQDFNWLDAQREAAEAYIQSQRHEGWTLVPSQYSDGGCTGANMDRLGFRQLLADIEAGKIDCAVVYKVDRLSRSLIDFARMMEPFEKRGVYFVSITQQFNSARATSSSPLRRRASGPAGTSSSAMIWMPAPGSWWSIQRRPSGSGKCSVFIRRHSGHRDRPGGSTNAGDETSNGPRGSISSTAATHCGPVIYISCSAIFSTQAR
jgi:hypothetical protein